MLLLHSLWLSAVIANDYAPVEVQSDVSVPFRKASEGLSSAETQWMQERDNISQEALLRWLEASGLQDIDVRSYMANSSRSNVEATRIGLAFSGGGFRAMLSGAGMLAAMDMNTPGSSSKGGMGGLLQSASYVAGLSGGSWLVASMTANNWTTVPDLQQSKEVWNFDNPFDPISSGFLSGISWEISVLADIYAKEHAGFPVSITDLWGRLLCAQLIPGSDHGRDMHWSDMLNYGPLASHDMPFPILVCDSVNSSHLPPHITNHTQSPPASNTSVPLALQYNLSEFEVTPLELGSWDRNVYSFMETKYLGTNMSQGQPVDDERVTGYDNIGFLLGSTSSLFNEIVGGLSKISILSTLHEWVIDNIGGNKYIDLAVIGPNPFKGVQWATPGIRDADMLELVDGGEDDQNLPFAPLVQAEREVDVIIALDNSADVNNFPQGVAPWATCQLDQLRVGPKRFPVVPEPSEYPQLGLVGRPVFFGCDLEEGVEAKDAPPLVVYVPNSDQSYASNEPTFKLSYSSSERDSMIKNGYNVMTRNNGTTDSQWRSCVACTILLRQQQRNGDSPTSQCSSCFDRYCYRPSK